jgi:hypothetical protein
MELINLQQNHENKKKEISRLKSRLDEFSSPINKGIPLFFFF